LQRPFVGGDGALEIVGAVFDGGKVVVGKPLAW
jgi:hypothetical protein